MLKRLWVLGVLVIASLSLDAAQGAPRDAQQYIVVLKDGANRASAIANAKQLGGDVSRQYRHALNGFALTASAQALAGIERNPDVLFVSPDIELEAAAPPPPPTDPQVTQRSVDRIDADKSSTRSGDGRGSVPINVAVLDSGADTDHPDLNVVGGTNCVSDNGGFEDTYGHGTLVAGSIGALDNEIGFVGVAPGARIWAVRVIKKTGSLTIGMLLCGIDWVTATRRDADPANDIAVANASLGARVGPANRDDGNCGLTNGDALHVAICGSIAAGVTWVVAAGNESRPIEEYVPAAFDEVLTATAMTDTDGLPGGLGGNEIRCGLGYPDDTLAAFSNFATSEADASHTIAAPGVCVPSTFLGGVYARDSGTSFSAPLVAGTVALCIAGPCSGLTPRQIVAKIVADATAFNIDSKNFAYGFQGDPLRPISGKYYGYLIRAAQY